MPEPAAARVAEVLDQLCAAVAADGGAALYLDDGEGMLQLAAASGAVADGGGLVERLLGRRDTVGRTMSISLPQAGGFMILARRSGGDFTQQDRTVARLYGRQLADHGAVAGGQLVHSTWTRQLEAIQRIAARLTRLASVEEVGATICGETAEVIEHDEAHVLVVDERGQLRTVAAAGPAGREVPPLPVDGAGGDAVRRSLHGGVPVLAAVNDPGSGRSGPWSMLLAPLHYESRVSGLICLLAHGAQQFDDDDLRMLRILSDQAAVAMENSRLLDGRDELVQELAGLLEISEAAGVASDEAQLATLLAARLRRATRTDAALVALWDDGSTELRVVCRDGIGGTATTIDAADSPARRSVLRDGRPQVIQADSADVGIEAQQLRQVGGKTLLLLPLNAGGRTIGLLELLATGRPRSLSEAEMQACEAMAGLAAAGLERVRVAEQLRRAADMDLVTGVHNHRYLQERLRQEVARSARSHSPLAVLMLDLDRFKPINDRHGHADGDRVLHNVGATIRAQVRTSDVVARYGGDEFVVLMPDTADEQAEHVARRVVAGILKSRHTLSDGSTVSVGVSAGLSVYPTDGRTSAQLLGAADAAMYAAKRTGGRQVERSRAPLSMDAAPAAVPAAG